LNSRHTSLDASIRAEAWGEALSGSSDPELLDPPHQTSESSLVSGPLSVELVTELRAQLARYPDDRGRFRDAWTESASDRLPMQATLRLVLPDGAMRWVEVRGGWPESYREKWSHLWLDGRGGGRSPYAGRNQSMLGGTEPTGAAHDGSVPSTRSSSVPPNGRVEAPPVLPVG